MIADVMTKGLSKTVFEKFSYDLIRCAQTKVNYFPLKIT